MARKKDDGWGIVVGVGLFALVAILYYSQTGQGANDAALIPNQLESKIDQLVAVLNNRLGHQWLAFGIYEIRSYLQRTQPQLLALVDVVVKVEQLSKSMQINKRQSALRMLRG